VTRHHILRTPARYPSESQGTITLVTKSTTSSLLATCRTINSEASRIFAPQLKKLRAEPLRLIVDSLAIDSHFVQRGLLSLLSRFEALAAHVISSSTPPPSTSPHPSAGTPFDNFIDECVSYLSCTASLSAPAQQARDIVITFAVTPGHTFDIFSMSSLTCVQAIGYGIARFAGSFAVIQMPEGNVKKWKHDAFQSLMIRAWNSKAVEWRTEEQWREEWDEGEEL
jgi:hypothetical protein